MDETISDPSIPTDMLYFRQPADDTSFFNKLNEMWQNETLCDINLAAGGRCIKAHQLILLASSETLSNKVLSISDKPDPVLEVDADPDSLHIVLSYIYHNGIAVSKEKLLTVAEAAQQLGMKELRKRCLTAHFAALPLRAETCLNIWKGTKETGQETLSQNAMQFAVSNFPNVKNTGAFKHLHGDMLETYVCHPDLATESQEDRLMAAIDWSRSNCSQLETFNKVIDGLAIQQMDHALLEVLLNENPIVKSNPVVSARIRAILGITEGEKTDIQEPLSPQACKPANCKETETCFIFVGISVEGKRNDEVMMVQMEQGYKMTVLGNLGASFPDGPFRFGYTNCCVSGEHLYASCLGSKGNEIWSFHLRSGESVLHTRTAVQRHRHGMFADQIGKIFLFGGQTIGVIPRQTNAVEVLDTSSPDKTVKDLAELTFGSEYRHFCVDLEEEHLMLVCGGKTKSGKNVLQVYEYGCEAARGYMELPENVGDNVYGAVFALDHVVMVTDNKVVAVHLNDILRCDNSNAKVCENFGTPNKWCAVIKDPAGINIILLGGKPKDGSRRWCFTYQARVEDVLNDAASGWTTAAIPWILGDCMFVGGYTVVDIKPPV